MNLERITVEFHAEEDRLMVRVFFGQKTKADRDISLAVPTFMHAPAEEDSGRTVN